MAAGYGLMKDDDETPVYREPVVVNVTDEEVIFEIATSPGSRPRRYKLAPYGDSAGRDRVNLPEGYANEYEGAGTHKMCTPIIERITRREVYPAGPLVHDASQNKLVPKYPAGPALPRVVNEKRAARARAEWMRAVQSEKQATAKRTTTVQLEVSPDDLVPRKARVKPALEEVGGEPPEEDHENLLEDDLPVAPPPQPEPPSSKPSGKGAK